jgi:hypothetical protein
MTITIQVDGLDGLQKMLGRIPAETEKRLGKLINATGLNITTDVKRRIQRGAKTGRVYRRGNVTHRASSPGEAPATDTGTLVSSVYFETGKLSATLGSRLAYAYWLEFGTQRMAARPAWVPAVEAAREKFAADVRRIIGEAINASG